LPENMREHGSVEDDVVHQDEGLHSRLCLRGWIRARRLQWRLHPREQLSQSEALNLVNTKDFRHVTMDRRWKEAQETSGI